MLRLLLTRTPLKRLARGAPVLALLSAAEVARLAGEHVGRLEAGEPRRLLHLLGKLRRGRGSLSHAEREELGTLVAKLEPRAFAGSAARKLSPVPVPKRLAYGPRGSRARALVDGPPRGRRSTVED